MLPFLEDLRAFYENAEITALTSPQGKDLLENAGHVDKCVVSEVFWLQGAESAFSFCALKDILKIKKALEPPYDIYVDVVSKYSLTGSIKPLVIKHLSRPRFSVGLSYKSRGFFLDLAIPEIREKPKHNIEKYNDILRALGCDAKFHLPRIKPSEEANEKAGIFFADFAGKTKIGLHPGANTKFFADRAWPVENFANLAKKLTAHAYRVVLIWGPGERERSLSIQQRCGGDVVLAPPLSLFY